MYWKEGTQKYNLGTRNSYKGKKSEELCQITLL